MNVQTMELKTIKFETIRFETIRSETKGPIAWIRMNRPDAMNSFDTQMVVDFNAATDAFRDDPQLKAAVVTGEGGRAFSAGRDMKEKRGGDERARPTLKLVEQGYCNKPLVAAIRGHCIGQGVAVALGCDLRVCAADASFSVPELAHGLALGGLAGLIVRAIGLAAATELCLLAEKRDAAWALQYGLAHRVVAVGEEEAAAEALALRLAGWDAAAMAVSKQSLNKAVDLTMKELVAFADPLRLELSQARLARKAAGGE